MSVSVYLTEKLKDVTWASPVSGFTSHQSKKGL